MQQRRPSAAACAVLSAALVAAIVVHLHPHVTANGETWRSLVKQTPISPAWWADAGIQVIVFALQLAAVAYIWLPTGYSIDHRKTVLTETVATCWVLQWAALAAADLAHAALSPGPAALAATSLLGSLSGLVLLYACLCRLHPLMVRVRKAEEAGRQQAGKGAKGRAAPGLVARGTSWPTAYCLFRLPTAMAAALCAARVISDAACLAVVGLGVGQHALLNPALGMLCGLMVLGVTALNHLEDVAFTATVFAWLVCLIIAAHTLMVVKCFCIALLVAIAMRTAFKYVPDEAEPEDKTD